MLTSWHFGAGGDILCQKHAYWTEKCEKLELHYSRNPPMCRNSAWLTSERVLNKTWDAIISENLYL